MMMVTCEQLWKCYCSEYFLSASRLGLKDLHIRGKMFGELVIIWSWEQWREVEFMRRKTVEAIASIKEICE